MEVSLLVAPIELDSIRLTAESMMRKRAQGIFAITSTTDYEAAIPMVESNLVNLISVTATTGGYPTAELTELTYSTVAGRLEIDGLTTSGLPNNRRYWTSFGQLAEDVFFGRIPELLDCHSLWLDQNTSTLYWSDMADGIHLNASTETSIMQATESKASSDFFE